ncbi:MAG: HAMP domain-containing sensor histidine kinase [Campylobacterota bacterium]|nr:HAMP domain-containing sensor histidine kinase [Campylobacterota bacterium]
MLSSEQKSFIRFLVIYLGSTFLLFSLASWIFYLSSKHDLYDKQRESLEYQSENIKSKLRHLHKSFDEKLTYPQIKTFDSAIFDLDKNYIFGTFKEKPYLTSEGYYEKDTRLYYISKVEPYYLGAAYLMLSMQIDKEPIVLLEQKIILFMLAAGVIFSILGYFLGKLFIASMRDAIDKMNNFIQDTTHELNTPISTILTNIELIETYGMYKKSDELHRIGIASKTLSRIYEDLTYLNLNHEYYRQIEKINITEMIKQRVVYFSTMTQHKRLNVLLELSPNVTLEMDQNDAIRLIDNLISNAIKYNKIKGNLTIKLTPKSLSVIDTGIGISDKDLKDILKRFRRFNKSEGGFGIGLDIVNQVVNSYKFNLEITSKTEVGTEVEIKW